ncbi:MAG TPA: hypothetical protein VE244_00595 [Nitrososphaeraceae archaeon]|jgi:hypothetical protein|nr:hypothetical protein [Nitrososphaeraceae archaeon]
MDTLTTQTAILSIWIRVKYSTEEYQNNSIEARTFGQLSNNLAIDTEILP